jgi:coproporphyrinogen III oxidase-like Fe-S oxidoreductase
MKVIHPLTGILDDQLEMCEGLKAHRKGNQEHLIAIHAALVKKICNYVSLVKLLLFHSKLGHWNQYSSFLRQDLETFEEELMS